MHLFVLFIRFDEIRPFVEGLVDVKVYPVTDIGTFGYCGLRSQRDA
jgi:hypothetical protein